MVVPLKYFLSLFITCFFINFYNCLGQNQDHYKVLNQKDSLPIENVYISANNILTSISGTDGKFEINKNFETLQLSHVAFKPLILSKGDITNKTIYLEENTDELDEIIISNKKETSTLLPSNDYNMLFRKSKGFTANDNTVYATLIPNQTKKTGLIKKIIIEVSEGIDGDPNKVFMPFRVNLFSVDPITKLPEKELLKESILTSKKKDAQDNFVHVDISDFFIDFAEEGIFVAVKTLNLLELENYGNNNGQALAFRALPLKRKNIYVTYNRFYSWARPWDSREIDNDIIEVDWIDDTIPNPSFIYNFGVEVQF